MTTTGIAILTAYLVGPILLGFAFPRRLRLLSAVGALALLTNLIWQLLFRPITVDMPVWFAVLLAVGASVVALGVCASCAFVGSRARRRLHPHREQGAA